MEHYPVTKRKEILPCATTWVDFESITLSKISQTKTNTACSHFEVKPSGKKKTKKKNMMEDIVRKRIYMYIYIYIHMCVCIYI